MKLVFWSVVLSFFSILRTSDLKSQEPIRISGQSLDSIGFNSITGKKIVANRISFDANIYYTYVDSINNDILMQLRPTTQNGKYYKPKGEVVAIDPQTVKVKWRREVNYANSLISNFSKHIIERRNKKSICVDMRSGEDLWEVKSYILEVFPKLKIALGYNAANRKRKGIDLQGIDMTNGDILWTREVDRNYGWREFLVIDSITALMSASGIHSVNLKTGKGWSYHERSGKTRYNFWTDTNTLYNISSNVIIDSTSIYYASSKDMVRFDYSGNEIWTYRFPDDMVSKSLIFLHENKVIMMNTGMVNSTNGIDKPYGKPFIASFDRTTGKKDFLEIINSAKQNRMLTWKIINNLAYVGLKKELRVYNINDGSILNSMPLDVDAIGNIVHTVGPQAYLKMPDGKYSNVYDSVEKEVYFIGDKGVMFGVDKNLKVSGLKKLTEFYIHYTTIDDMKFLAKNNHTVVLSPEGIILFELGLSQGTRRIYDDIYNSQENSLLILDWNQFK